MPTKGLLINGIPLSLSNILNFENFKTNKAHNEVSFHRNYGSGKISLNQFDKDYITLEVDIKPNTDLEVNLEFLNSDFLLFLFVSKGNSMISFETPKSLKNIEEYCSLSVYTEYNRLKAINFKKAEHVVLNALCISNKTFLKVCDDFSQMDICNDNLAQVLNGLEQNIYSTDFGYNIIDELKK